jgi:hypothetical protein
MTDITTLLAEALHGASGICQDSTEGRCYWHHAHAAAIFATPAGQTLARQAAIGAAVEALEADHRVITWEVGSGYEDAYVADVSLFVGENFGPPIERRVKDGPTLPDAIAAALGDEP